MSQALLRYELLEDDRVIIQMYLEDVPLAHMFFEAPELSSLIDGLAALRGRMGDPVADQLDPGSRLQAVVDPVWRVEPNSAGKLLALRHPGLGWQGFLLPLLEAEAMALFLGARSPSPLDKAGT